MCYSRKTSEMTRALRTVQKMRKGRALFVCRKGKSEMYDVIVVGGGPAGMTAALYAVRNGKSALVIEKEGFGGQITHSPKVENIPGFASLSGNEFAEKMLDQILGQGAEIEIDTVVSVEDKGAVKVVTTEGESRFEGRAVILANGVKGRGHAGRAAAYNDYIIHFYFFLSYMQRGPCLSASSALSAGP